MKDKKQGRPLTSLRGFIERVEKVQREGEVSLFYRGHSNRDSYKIEPSVFRNDTRINLEDSFVKEMITTNPDEFADDSSTLERLARIQHHAGVTRLLDISSNPLVGLYFACSGSPGVHGEVIIFKAKSNQVKFFDSDTVSCLSNLSRLTSEEKDNLDLSLDKFSFNSSYTAKRLLHFIKEEKPYFLDEINPGDLSKAVVVRPKVSNKRLLAQSGSFLLFGQIRQIEKGALDEIDIERIIIDKSSKSSILKDLDSLNINFGSLYLDIDSYASYIKEKWGM
jgi:hypothetical protein